MGDIDIDQPHTSVVYPNCSGQSLLDGEVVHDEVLILNKSVKYILVHHLPNELRVEAIDSYQDTWLLQLLCANALRGICEYR